MGIDNEMKRILLTLAAVLAVAAIYMQAEIRTMIHGGRDIRGYTVSYDEKYIYTRGENEISVWNLRTRMLEAELPLTALDVAPHPLSSGLIYVRGYTLGSTYEDHYTIIDWKTGDTIGAVPLSGVSSYAGVTDLNISKAVKSDVLLLSVPGVADPGTIGGVNYNAGSVHSNANDSLLVTSGMYPVVWDLRNARPVRSFSMRRYLSDDPTVNLEADFNFPYTRGYVGQTNFCNNYFMSGSNDVMLGGVGKKIALWGNNNNVKEEYDLEEGPTPALAFHGDTIVAAGKGVFRKLPGAGFERLGDISEAASSEHIYCISRPYGGNRFLIGTTPHRKGYSLLEGSLADGSVTRVPDFNHYFVQDLKISPDERYAVVVCEFHGLSRVDLTGDTLRYGPMLKAPVESASENFNCCEVLKDQSIVVGTTNGNIYIWGPGENESRLKRKEHGGSINCISLSADSTRMYTSDRTGQVTIWDTGTFEPIMKIYSMFDPAGEWNYIFITPDNYYKSMPGAHKFINFVKDGKAFNFEQFDLRNNRPDIVVERLGGSPETVDLLHKAWLKRLRRAGIRAEELAEGYHAPEIRLLNRDGIPQVTKTGEVTLDILCSDDLYDVTEVSVMLNNVPVLPSEMRSHDGSRKVRVTPTVPLAVGNNEISIMCYNRQGTGSVREIINVAYVPAEARKPDLYVVAAGVSRYAEPGHDLSYAGKDAADIAELAGKLPAGGFGNVRKLVLTDADFNAAALGRIRDFISGARRDDVVLLFYAGHGVLDADLDYYLAGHDMDFANPAKGGIPYEDFVGTFDATPAVNRYSFIDACHSGELDKEDCALVNTVEMPEGEELVFRAGGNALKAKEEVETINRLMNDMFADTRWDVGATVLSSAGAAEFAVESDEWRNGLFTYCLKEGFTSSQADLNHDGKISFSELIDHTAKRVKELSGGSQTPTVRSNNNRSNIILTTL